MRLAADTLAPEANAVASRPWVASRAACASSALPTWRCVGRYGFAGTKPSTPMMTIPVDQAHAGNLTTRRLSEASP